MLRKYKWKSKISRTPWKDQTYESQMKKKEKRYKLKALTTYSIEW
jgi:hypothetical protein